MNAAEDIPLILEDKTGVPTDTEFRDIYGRLVLLVRPTRADASTVLIVDAAHSAPPPAWPTPDAVILFGRSGGLGELCIGDRQAVPIDTYLQRINRSAPTRRFVASDGRQYTWCFRPTREPHEEWVCFDVRNNAVADYTLKIEEDREYAGTSGNSVTVMLPWAHLAAEFVATLTIMRYLQAHRL